MSNWRTTFPNSSKHYCEDHSPTSNRYNCIGFAVGSTTKFYWPVRHPVHYWPADVPLEVSVRAFTALFYEHGYSIASGPDLETEFEKIALYTDRNGVPTHAARQGPDGVWLSKLGRGEDIRHELEALEGNAYGSATRFYKRPIK